MLARLLFKRIVSLSLSLLWGLATLPLSVELLGELVLVMDDEIEV